MPNQRLKLLLIRAIVLGLSAGHIVLVISSVRADTYPDPYPDRVIHRPKNYQPESFPQFFRREIQSTRGYRYGSAAVKTVYRNFFDLRSTGRVGARVEQFYRRQPVSWVQPVRAAELPRYPQTVTRRRMAVAFNSTRPRSRRVAARAQPRFPRRLAVRRAYRPVARPIAYRRHYQ